MHVHYSNTLVKVRYWLTINEQNTMILHPGAIGVPKGGKLPTKKRTLPAKPPYAYSSRKSHAALSRDVSKWENWASN